MKVLYPLLTVLFTGFALGASAQAISVGPRVGVNVSNFAVKPYNIGTPLGAEAVTHFEDTRETLTSLQAGVMVNIGFDDNFSLQPELNYSVKGVKRSGNVAGIAEEQEIKLNYLELPVLFKYTIGGESFNASLLAGPYFAYLIGGSDKYTAGGATQYDGDIKFKFDDKLPYKFNHFDLGGTIGAELGYKTSKGTFLLDARYNIGVKEMIDYQPELGETALRLTNRTFGVSIGWLYHFPYTPKVKDYGDIFDEEDMEDMPAPSATPTPQEDTPQEGTPQESTPVEETPQQ